MFSNFIFIIFLYCLTQLNFVRSYLKTIGKEGPTEEERVMMEIKIFFLASHLFWGLWSIVNAKLSEIPFGYWVCINLSNVYIFFS